MRIELLYFDGCPNHEALLPHLRELLDRADVHEEIRLVRVGSPEDAERERFLGSPTLRIDGRDVDPDADKRADYGFRCRLYRTSSGFGGTPADEWIVEAVRTGSTDTQQIGDHAWPDGALAPRSWASHRLGGLTESKRRLHQRILRSMASGRRVEARHLARWAGDERLDLESAMEELEGRDLALRDPRTGAISVAYPFSASPTAHRVRLAGDVRGYGMCAIDALGVAFMTRQAVEIRSTDAGTRAEIEICVNPHGASDWRPRDAVVVLGCADGGASADCMCPHTNFAVSPASGQAQLDALAGCSGSLLSMPEAIEAGRDIFGALLTNDEETGHARADRA